MKPIHRWPLVLIVAIGICGANLVACAANQAEGEAPESTVAARIGESEISLQELDAQVQKTNPRAYQQYYDARRAALEELINGRLLSAEAESRGLSEQELRQEVTGAAPEVTDAEVEGFYNQNQARMGNRTLDQMRAQIRNYLVSQGQRKALNDLLVKLKEKSAVRVYLEPPRVEVKIAANDPSQGPENAPILLVEYSDFQ